MQSIKCTLVDSYGWVSYCNTSDSVDIWPQVYEKAFAKWTTQDPSDESNITTLAGGNPGYAIAQLTDKTCYYYDTLPHTPDELCGIVRENSVAFKTLKPDDSLDIWVWRPVLWKQCCGQPYIYAPTKPVYKIMVLDMHICHFIRKRLVSCFVSYSMQDEVEL